MGELVEKGLACLSYECGSSDALALYFDEEEDLYNAHCYSCGRNFYRDQVPENQGKTMLKQPKPKVDYTSELERIAQLPCDAMPDRAISKESAEHFGIRTEYSQQTGEPVLRYFPYYRQGILVAYKKKWVDKSREPTWVGDGKKAELFGAKAVKGTKFMIITEGEEDAAAARDMLKRRGKNWNVASLPSGAQSASGAIQNSYKWLYEFTQINLAFDNDKPGKDAAQAASKLFDPGQAKVTEFTKFKDSNEYLINNSGDVWMNDIYNAITRKPDGIVTISDIFEEARRKPKWGLPWMWDGLTKATYGRREGELYGVGAGTGVGKSEFFKELVSHVIHQDDMPIGCAFLEEPAVMSAKRIAGKIANKKFYLPDAEYEQEELDGSLMSLDKKLWLYDHNGYKDWKSISSYFKFLARSMGVRDFILDNLTAVVAQEENEYSALNAIMEEMASLAIELEARIYYASHLRKAERKPHEEGGRVQLREFKGSGAMGNWSHFIFGIERDTQAEDPNDRNTSILRILKDRYTGISTGDTFSMWYDHSTGVYREKLENDSLYEEDVF